MCRRSAKRRAVPWQGEAVQGRMRPGFPPGSASTCSCWSRKDRLAARPLPAGVMSRGTGSEPLGLPLNKRVGGSSATEESAAIPRSWERKPRAKAGGTGKAATQPPPACLPAPPVLTTAECCCGGMKGEGVVASAAGAAGISAATAAARGAESWGVQLSAPVTTLQPRMLAAAGWTSAALVALRQGSRHQVGDARVPGAPPGAVGGCACVPCLGSALQAGQRAGRRRGAPGLAKSRRLSCRGLQAVLPGALARDGWDGGSRNARGATLPPPSTSGAAAALLLGDNAATPLDQTLELPPT